MLKHPLIIVCIVAAAALLLFSSLFSLIKISNLQKQLSEQQSKIFSELEIYRDTEDYHIQMDQLLSADLNRLRASLGLNLREYPVYPGSDEELSIEENRFNSDFYDGITVLLEAEQKNKKSALLGRFIRNSMISEVLTDGEIETKKTTGNKTLFLLNGFTFLTASAESTSEVLLTSFNGENLKTSSPSKEAVYFIEKSLSEYKNYSSKRLRIEEILENTLIDESVLSACGKTVRIDKRTDSAIFIVENNKNSVTVSIIESSNKPFIKISGDDREYTDPETFKTAIVSAINNLDRRPPEEIILDAPKERINSLYKNNEFNDYLSRYNLNLSNEVREDNDYIYYDINKENGERLGSFSILKKLGELYLVDSDEIPISSLKTISVRKEIDNHSEKDLIIPENIPEIATLYSNEDTVNFLLVGTHERNTDTMILAHADKRTGKAYLIGIPRDLYWKGRKINSIYQDFGAERFKKELSEITGLEITNYIKIDMYAFIDIVNLLGGIEVTLTEDLIDPTYRTRENGEWSTLNYKKGTYNLNGVEALRIARSRHGSNDFNRSQRQQIIIESFLSRFKELNILDINKVYGFIQVFSKYVESDFSLMELMSVYNNFGDSELAGKHVLSFDNILYDTYSNIYMFDEDDFEPGPDFNKGAWILLPEGNDWNNIRWYVRKIINGEMKVD